MSIAQMARQLSLVGTLPVYTGSSRYVKGGAFPRRVSLLGFTQKRAASKGGYRGSAEPRCAALAMIVLDDLHGGDLPASAALEPFGPSLAGSSPTAREIIHLPKAGVKPSPQDFLTPCSPCRPPSRGSPWV